MPLATIANSTAEPASRVLEVRIFGDGHLPFSMITPDGDALTLTWDVTSRSGSMKQEGRNRYTIDKWTVAGKSD